MANQFKRNTEEIGRLIGDNFNMGWHIKRDKENVAIAMLKRPEALTPDKDGHIYPVDQVLFWEKISLYIKDQDIIEDGIHNSYSLIMGQWSEGVFTKV